MLTILAVIALTLLRLVIPVGLLLSIGTLINRRGALHLPGC